MTDHSAVGRLARIVASAVVLGGSAFAIAGCAGDESTAPSTRHATMTTAAQVPTPNAAPFPALTDKNVNPVCGVPLTPILAPTAILENQGNSR